MHQARLSPMCKALSKQRVEYRSLVTWQSHPDPSYLSLLLNYKHNSASIRYSHHACWTKGFNIHSLLAPLPAALSYFCMSHHSFHSHSPPQAWSQCLACFSTLDHLSIDQSALCAAPLVTSKWNNSHNLWPTNCSIEWGLIMIIICRKIQLSTGKYQWPWCWSKLSGHRLFLIWIQRCIKEGKNQKVLS